MIVKAIYESAINNLSTITNINKYITSEVVEHIRDDLTCWLFINKNLEADNILEKLNTTPSIYWLDKYFAFWIYEVSHSMSDNIESYNALINKFSFIRDVLISSENAKRLINLDPIDSALYNNKMIREKYIRKLDDAVILTAAPEEFKAMLRKIGIIINVFNRNTIVEVINPDTDPETIRKRKKMWVDGIIFRNNEYVKIKLILTEEYGSVATIDSLNAVKDRNFCPAEIIVMGVAGHLDKKEVVKIGDLVISDSYYNAYLHKDIELLDLKNTDLINTVYYNDKTRKPLSDEYNVKDKFNYETWQPKGMVVNRPVVNNTVTQSAESKVYKGTIVSGPSVVKQNFKKEILQENFDKALAVEMETYGAYSFVHNIRGLKLKVIKGISDWADPNKEKSWQPFCADFASEFTIDYLIAKYGKQIEG
jgi:nucleoside phosphorylase